MTRILMMSLLACLLGPVSIAQFPQTKEYSVSDISTVSFSHSGAAGKSKIKAEVPPWIISGGLKSYFFVDGSETYIWSSAASLVHDKKIDLSSAIGPALASASYIHSPNFHPSNKINNWKRNYHAIYSAAYIVHPVQGPVTLGFLHGENKNQVEGNINDPFARFYQNTIQQHITIDPSDHHTYSGGEPFVEGWQAYNAMISAAWVPNNARTNWGQQFFNNDLGPIVWPSTGYITSNGKKCTSGLKHPSSIVADGFVYVFYTDGGPFGHNIPAEHGRLEGVKVARAPIEKSLDPGAYTVYFRDLSGRGSWSTSLPGGFTKENMLDYVAVKGPKTTDIMNDSNGVSQEIRFSVAKVRNTDYYMGVEEYIDVKDGKKFKVALRLSRDLVNWSERTLVVNEAADWNATKLNYPVLLSKEGWSNTEIDIDDFYILGTGTSPQKHVNKIHLKSAVPQSTQTLMTVPGNRILSSAKNLLYPNPTYGSFRISYHLDEASRVRVSLLDLTGRNLGMLKNETRNAGNYSEDVRIESFPAGAYVIEMTTNNSRQLYKIVKQ